MIKSPYSLTNIFFSSSRFWFGPAFWAFCIINTPSLKLLYLSPLVNLAVIIGLYGSYFVRSAKIHFDQTRVTCLIILSFFWGILLVSGALGLDAMVDLDLFLRYVSVYFALVAVIFCVNRKDIPFIISWQILWGTALSLYQVIYQFSYANYDGSIHYNTVAIPMASSLVAIFGILFFSRRKVTSTLAKIALWFCAICNLLGITSLTGRGPIIYSLMVILLIIFSRLNYRQIFTGKNIGNLLKTLAVMGIISYLAYINIIARLSQWQIDRYLRIVQKIGEEPRIKAYQIAIEAIANNPFGYGLNAAVNLKNGFYPHNLFLEILISAGIIALIPFLILVVWYGRKFFCVILSDTEHVFFAMMSSYLFLTWNTSFDLASSYVPIGSMLMLICTSSKIGKQNKQNSQVWRSPYLSN